MSVISKIDTNIPFEVLTVLAEGCGFHLAFDHTPGTDVWTLSTKRGDKYIQHVGTKESVVGFLIGYAVMQLETKKILSDLDSAQHKLILDMQTRLDSP